MEQNEALFQKTQREKEDLVIENLRLQKELQDLKNQSQKESSMLRKSVIDMRQQLTEEVNTHDSLEMEHQEVQQSYA